MRIKISPSARRDVIDIWHYGAKHFGDVQADAYLDALSLRLQWLCVHRNLWRARPDLSPELFAYPHASHMIYFRHQQAEMIEIARILHQQMDAERHV